MLKVNKVVPQKKRMVTKLVRGLTVQAMNARNQLEACEGPPRMARGTLKINMDREMESLKKAWETAKPVLE